MPSVDDQTALAFATRAPTVALRDPLAEFLGALRPGGTFRYGYEDAVKLCGHSCPTIARAYLMTVVALGRLYPGDTPVRGDIEVTVGGERDDGGSGPMALVVGLLTGAAPETGFGGLMGRWRRKDLLRFDARLAGRMRFRRTDTGAAVEVACDTGLVPPSPELPTLMRAALGGQASAEEHRRFATLWQDRVERMVTGDPTRIVQVFDLDPVPGGSG
ncbi:MAG: hypothetical protein IT294_09185 [Deltaproteobacteria bacterium]|nr:hypothetical protein [Deltaproteobacteria bacterium]